MKLRTIGVTVAWVLVLGPVLRAEQPYQTAWVRQLGTSADEYSWAVSADGLGNVYISGETWGSLDGPNEGPYDAFVSKYDTGGTLLWTRQIGTVARDESYGVSGDGFGNVYISGFTNGPDEQSFDAFVAKFTPVPEPATLCLLAMGGLALLRSRRS